MLSNLEFSIFDDFEDMSILNGVEGANSTEECLKDEFENITEDCLKVDEDTSVDISSDVNEQSKEVINNVVVENKISQKHERYLRDCLLKDNTVFGMSTVELVNIAKMLISDIEEVREVFIKPTFDLSSKNVSTVVGTDMLVVTDTCLVSINFIKGYGTLKAVESGRNSWKIEFADSCCFCDNVLLQCNSNFIQPMQDVLKLNYPNETIANSTFYIRNLVVFKSSTGGVQCKDARKVGLQSTQVIAYDDLHDVLAKYIRDRMTDKSIAKMLSTEIRKVWRTEKPYKDMFAIPDAVVLSDVEYQFKGVPNSVYVSEDSEYSDISWANFVFKKQ